MKKIIIGIILAFSLITCNNSNEGLEHTAAVNQVAEKSEGLYHYSIWWAFVNRIFDGTLTANELKQKGDIALGSYNSLSGELVMLDGNLYKVTEDGVVHKAIDNDSICYANATWFKDDKSYDLNEETNYEKLRSSLTNNMPSKNQFYAFKIKGTFSYMKCGGVPEQKKPYTKGLDVLLPERPVFEKKNLSGTMVGFYCPDFIGNINAVGFHLHFISDDAGFGGHVMEFEAKKLNIRMDYITKYTFVLPETEAYLNGSFEKEFQYNKK